MSDINITINNIWHDLQAPGQENLANLAESINHSYAMRDAVLLAAVDDTLDRDTFARVIKDPHGTKDEMDSRLTRTYHHPGSIPRIRVQRIADGLAEEGVRRHLAHPLASAAYLHWVLGDYQIAVDLANAALSVDANTSLASLVISAICHGISWGR